MGKRCLFHLLLVLVCFGLLAVLAGCALPEPKNKRAVPPAQGATPAAEISELPADVSPPPDEANAGTGQDISPLPTPSFPPPELAPELPEPTSTTPPFPTPLPTPVVTPIPTAAPPIIPLPDGETQPYRLIFQDGNTINITNSDGSDTQSLIDTRAELGLFIAGRSVSVTSVERGGPSPDGKQLALVLSDVESLRSLPKGQTPVYSIYLFDIPSRSARLLVPDGVEPVWSPDGARIAYRSTKTCGLWIVDVASGETREIYRIEEQACGPRFVANMRWAPDSRQLVFMDLVFQESQMIMTIDVDRPDSATVIVPDTGYWLYCPEWSPDGGKILYLSSAGKIRGPDHIDHLWVMNPDGTEQVQLTQDINLLSGGWPHWSPDGQWITFGGLQHYTAATPAYDIWIIDRTGNQLKRLTSNTAEGINEVGPVWSPDGTELLFTREQTEVWKISLRDGQRTKVPVAGVNFWVSQ